MYGHLNPSPLVHPNGSLYLLALTEPFGINARREKRRFFPYLNAQRNPPRSLQTVSVMPMASIVHNPTWTAPSANKRKPETLFSLADEQSRDTPAHPQPRAPHRVRVQHPETARGECYHYTRPQTLNSRALNRQGPKWERLVY